MELIIEEINDKLVSITCPGGIVKDTRNGNLYSEVVDLKKYIKYYIGQSK